MSQFASSFLRSIRVVEWGTLFVLLILPLLFVACTIKSEPAKEPFIPAEGATVIDEMKLAFILPAGWWQNGEPVRSTAFDYAEQFTPQERESLKKTDPERLNRDPDYLESALYMYIYHNLAAYQDSLPANPEEELFFHMLTLDVRTYYEEHQLDEWDGGRCGNGEDRYCDEGTPPANLELIRVLEPDENPFPEGTGVLYNVTRAEVPVVAYIYYMVRDGWAYRISYEVTTNEIGDEPYPLLLDTIQFME